MQLSRCSLSCREAHNIHAWMHHMTILLFKSSNVGVGRVHYVLEVVVLLICVMSGRDTTSVTVSVHKVVTWKSRSNMLPKCVVLLICVMSGRETTSVTVSVYEVVTWNSRKQYATKVLALGKPLEAIQVGVGREHRPGTMLSTGMQ